MGSREMREELQKYLDGELPAELLPAELQQEAAAWDALIEDVRRTAASGAPAWLEARILSAVRAPDDPRWRRWLGWLTSPRTIRVAPAPAVAVLALLAAALALPWIGRSAGPAEDGTVYVQLFLEAPAASSVAIAGDFSRWDPIELEDQDGDGVWSARLAVRPGVYEYMFVLDGSRWVTDPHAERYSDDGFGNRNAVLAILPEGTGT
ncbi:MAG: glycogen-binding domain-containing protein [Gemmatimonadota bacterium]|nr:MAG: glycogen-binding domain-containing protein [Gemmatimonadota bacterium]